jgi:hypothetical protein
MFLWYPIIEHAQYLTGYHVFMVSSLDFARVPRRAQLTARKKGSGYENEGVSLKRRPLEINLSTIVVKHNYFAPPGN